MLIQLEIISAIYPINFNFKKVKYSLKLVWTTEN